MRCSLIQWRLSNVVNGDARLTESMKAHLKRCQKCRTFFQSSVQISAQLTEEAHSTHAEAPHDLNDRILSALEKAQTAIRHSRDYNRVFNVKTLSIAACLLLFASLALWLVILRQEKPGKMQPDPFAAIEDIIKDISPSRKQLASSAQTLPDIIVEPYRKEMASLAGDTESAVKFLVSCVGVNLSDRSLLPSYQVEKNPEQVNQ